MRWTIWLSHHAPEDAERCTAIAGLAVCRRCLACWPVALLVIFACVGLAQPVGSSLELAALWTLPLGEYVAVHALARPYSPRRTWFVGVILGVAMGRTLHRYLLDPSDPVAWVALGIAGGVGGLSALVHHSRV